MANAELQNLKKSCVSHINKFRCQRPLRAQSLLMTVFGDSILPCGGSIWLGSLIKLVVPFGVNQRLVRTSVYRLVQDEWLETEQMGKRSYYSLTNVAKHKVQLAEKKIFNEVSYVWDKAWRLVFTGVAGVTREQREKLRQELLWQGFGQISAHVYVHPIAPIESVIQTLETMKLDKKVVVMLAKNIDEEHGSSVFEMVSQCCDINTINKDYRSFIKKYKLIDKYRSSIKDLDDEFCFLLRTLLIHDYRRIILRDPQLPKELLSADWAGENARQLCAAIYNATSEKVENYLMAKCETPKGQMLVSDTSYYERFKI